ncbi:hypothetical protein ACSVH2_04405 [Flavobacterium sp. RSB2_4_14]|uniref:hypothetical protein n=1 Tax=Flavobacterium sp. RSB2_4_14 TaxID=3447665 RepID=UPI003F2F436E
MRFKILFLFFCIQSFGFNPSNELVFLKGKVVCSVKNLTDVNVTNLRSETTTITNEKGDYSMFVKIGDTLQFSSLQIVTKKVIIQEIDLSKSLFVTSLEPKVIPLNEVKIIEYKNINAVALGILDKPAKKYTPAERKLAAAGEFHWYSPLLIPLGGMSVDGLLNAINGRTAMLKKEVEVERKEMLLKKIEYQFNPEYFTENLKIPQEYVKGFWYYAIQEPRLVNEINAKNKNMARFIFAELATKYLELLNAPTE